MAGAWWQMHIWWNLPTAMGLAIAPFSSFAQRSYLSWLQTGKSKGLINRRFKIFPCTLSASGTLRWRWPSCDQVLTVKQLPSGFPQHSESAWVVLLQKHEYLAYSHHSFHCPLLLPWCTYICYSEKICVWDAICAICRCVSSVLEPLLPYMPFKNGFQAFVYILPLDWLGFREDTVKFCCYCR